MTNSSPDNNDLEMLQKAQEEEQKQQAAAQDPGVSGGFLISAGRSPWRICPNFSVLWRKA